RGRHTRFSRDWSSDVCSSDLISTSGRKPEGGSFLSMKTAKRKARKPAPKSKGTKEVAGEPAETHSLPREAAGLLVLSASLVTVRSEERRVGKECISERSQHQY